MVGRIYISDQPCPGKGGPPGGATLGAEPPKGSQRNLDFLNFRPAAAGLKVEKSETPRNPVKFLKISRGDFPMSENFPGDFQEFSQENPEQIPHNFPGGERGGHGLCCPKKKIFG